MSSSLPAKSTLELQQGLEQTLPSGAGEQNDESESDDLRERRDRLRDFPRQHRQRLASPPLARQGSQVGPESPVVDEDGRSVIPQSLQPLPLDLSSEYDY